MIHSKLEALPQDPGVYLFKNAQHSIIYIGKAKNLRHRVRSYFQSRNLDHKTKILKNFIYDLDYIVTDNELEALFLESNLVKKHKPKFNVNLKDDKAFLHIKVTVKETFPRVLLTRRIVDDGALYFGPFLPASLARNIIKIINRHFLLRSCDINIDGKLDRPCLEYYMKRCLGPCVGELCTQKVYEQAVVEVVLFLEGKNKKLISNLTEKMHKSSTEQQYEAAAFYRDRIQMIRDLTEKQKMIRNGKDDADVFAYYREGSRLALQLFTLRGGKIVGKREFFWETLSFFHPPKFLRDALQQYYLNAGFIPSQIYLPTRIEDQRLLNRWLTEKLQSTGRKLRVRINVPQRGSKHDLLLLVEKNAKIAFHHRFRVLRSKKDKILEKLKEKLDLPSTPRRIEAFDVSHIQGAENVAALVVCEDGAMNKSKYRKFKIKSVQGSDDCLSLYEAVYRCYNRRLTEQSVLPNLILIDGGKGQLHSAYQALCKLGIEEIPLASIAKQNEIIYVQDRAHPVVLDRTSPILHLVQEIRDEAHRFALSYHRKRRFLKDFQSELDQIPGIGIKRKKRLLRNFGSVARIRKADIEELIPFVGEKIALALKNSLN